MTKVFVATAVLSACGSDEPKTNAAAMVALGSTSVTGTVGLPVASLPTIEIRDAAGIPLSGIRFRVVVLNGGGTVTGTPSQTISGPTSLGTWTLGPQAGGQQIRVESSGLPKITITATVSASNPTNVAAFVATSGAGFFSNLSTLVPAVRVTDPFGNGVAGVNVTVTVGAGSGSVGTPSPVTNANGVATVGSWTLGPSAADQSLTMTAGALTPIQFNMAVSAAFRVDVRFVGPAPSAAVQAAATLAATRIGQVITGDIPNQQTNVDLEGCAEGAGTVSETVDDIVIYVRVKAIDGASGVLAQAGPCIPIRTTAPYHPFYGTVFIDEADVTTMANNGTLNNVVLHEFFHTLGFGTMWVPFVSQVPQTNLLTNQIQFPSPSDPIFIGAEARAAYVASSGDAPAGVPVESGGGAGTAGQHWRETTLLTELMTGFANPGANPLSTISIGSLRDLGYVASYGTADAFTVPVGQLRAALMAPSVPLGNDVIIGVLRSPDGSPYRPPPPMAPDRR